MALLAVLHFQDVVGFRSAGSSEAAELVQLRRDNFADAVRQMPCRFLRGTHLAVKILLIIMDQRKYF